MVWGPVELRPGARLSIDSYTGNRNLAPRFAIAYDIFHGKAPVLFGGLNRYYGQVLLTEKLRTMQPPLVTQRRSYVGDQLTPWATSSVAINVNSTSDLHTPYTDEFSTGFDQALFGSHARVEYVYREGHDEIARELSESQPDGKKYYTFNNNGRSRYEAYRLAWQRKWRSGELLLNLTRSESFSSAEDYNVRLSTADDDSDNDVNRRAWYNGDTLSKDEVPRSDYNRTWAGNFSWLQRFPLGFEFTNVARYRSGYRAIEDTDKDLTLPDGEEVDVYAEVKHPQSWLFDWIVAWRAPSVAGVETRLVAEILNVFDSKINLGGTDDRYEQGRQIWAGVEGRF